MITLLSNPHDANIDPKEGWAQANCQQGPEWALGISLKIGNFSGLVTSIILIVPSEEQVANLYP